MRGLNLVSAKLSAEGSTAPCVQKLLMFLTFVHLGGPPVGSFRKPGGAACQVMGVFLLGFREVQQKTSVLPIVLGELTASAPLLSWLLGGGEWAFPEELPDRFRLGKASTVFQPLSQEVPSFTNPSNKFRSRWPRGWRPRKRKDGESAALLSRSAAAEGLCEQALRAFTASSCRRR